MDVKNLGEDPNVPINTGVGSSVSRWADAAMFRAEPMPAEARTKPAVTLLNATPDPLGSLAALCEMYQGRVIRSLAEVDNERRRYWLAEVTKSPLQGPLESIQFHFLVEGVTRAFTHQMVRGRHAFYAQESLRFAVVDGESWGDRVAYPPSLARKPDPYPSWELLPDADKEYILKRDIWDDAVINAETAYRKLIDAGIPAEDARGIMPHAMKTRLHWICSFRELLYVAGLRLCTQAQFEWRLAMAEIVKALRGYETRTTIDRREPSDEDWTFDSDRWQFAEMADRMQPVCYQQGGCKFMATDDRACAIRERVNILGRAGVPSDRWGEERWHVNTDHPTGFNVQVNVFEWAADPNAARRTS